MTDEVFRTCANKNPPVIPSVESFLGIIVAVLLLIGIGSGVYKNVRRNQAVDAYLLAERDIAKQDLPGALMAYTNAIQANHSYYDAYCRRATVYAELGNVQEAENDVKQALAIHPFWPFALDLKRQITHSKRKIQELRYPMHLLSSP